jgi:hypothetical protein
VPPKDGVFGRSDFAVVWLAAFAAAALVGTHGIAYWDAGDYVRLAISGGESGLLLGRPLFLLISRLVLRIGVDPAHAEVVLRWFWTVAGTAAAPLLGLLAARLGADRASALVAGLLLALSPSFAHTAHQVLTDAPALALSIAALCFAARGEPVGAGLVLAAAIATRETAAIHPLAVAWLCGRRAWIAVIVCVASVASVIAIWRPPSLGSWAGAMSSSVAANPLSIVDVAIAFGWVLAAGPVAVVTGSIALARPPSPRLPPSLELRRTGRWASLVPRDIAVIAWPAAIATVALMFYPDGSFSPRYMLATVPIAFFIPAALSLKAHRRLLVVSLAVPLIAALIATQPADRVAAYGATLGTRVSALPDNALVVPGHFCPQARLAAAVHGRADLMFVCPGWEWPVDLMSLLENAIANGSIVAIDASGEAWVGRREQPLRDEVRAWLQRHHVRQVAGFSVAGG